MLSPTPAVRAAIFGLVVVTVIAVAGAALHLDGVAREAERGALGGLDAQARSVAAALPLLGARGGLGHFDDGGADLLLYDARGRVSEATDDDLASLADWRRTAGAQEGAAVVEAAGRAYGVALGTLADGRQVVAVEPMPDELPQGVLLQTVTVTASLWGLLVGVFVVMTWYAGPRTATQLALLGERIAQGNGDGNALIRHAGVWLGPLADAFQPVVDRFRRQAVRAKDVQQHLAALYQVNPHYVVLCTLDGEIVEANPAFYAATGLPIEAVRGGRVEALDQTFPVLPLMELAERSLKEASAISGIEYAIINRDDETRPVEVSLRAFEIEGRPHVLFQATDHAHEKQLERRVAAFTDTLDLMVDQRVHQLSAGQQALKRVLDAAGVVVASFDAGGATSRWSGAARALTGQPIATVPHFAAAVQALGLSPTERTAFTQWFWSYASDPFVGRHGVVGRDGVTRTRQIVWQRVDADMAGRSDLRTVVGVEVPAHLDLRADAPHAGDGMARMAR